jgi:hypothetical protein
MNYQIFVQNVVLSKSFDWLKLKFIKCQLIHICHKFVNRQKWIKINAKNRITIIINVVNGLTL